MPALGGTFLSSHDPQRLVAWFADALGIEMEPQGEGGMAVFPAGESISILGVHAAREGAPRPPGGSVEAEPYGRQPMMLNLRVDDLDATMARLQATGNAVAGPTSYEGIGRFAWTRTPDGHDVELWQP
jgi:glyoxylase I family protein